MEACNPGGGFRWVRVCASPSTTDRAWNASCAAALAHPKIESGGGNSRGRSTRDDPAVPCPLPLLVPSLGLGLAPIPRRLRENPLPVDFRVMLLACIYEAFPLTRPLCGAKMRIIAFHRGAGTFHRGAGIRLRSNGVLVKRPNTRLPAPPFLLSGTAPTAHRKIQLQHLPASRFRARATHGVKHTCVAVNVFGGGLALAAEYLPGRVGRVRFNREAARPPPPTHSHSSTSTVRNSPGCAPATPRRPSQAAWCASSSASGSWM